MKTTKNIENAKENITTKKKVIFTFITICFIVIFMIIVAEFSLRFFRPQVILYPRWEKFQEYGYIQYKNIVMIHELPRKWKFKYAINKYGHRGATVPISNSYNKANIIILGDSYSFGLGVKDGEEYPSVMANLLADKYNVINLGIGGYGLTLEIRRYYEFGQLYQPKIVILQFCKNDLYDNFLRKMTEIKDGRFIFKNINISNALIRHYLSRNIIEKSQIYNFFNKYYQEKKIKNTEDLFELSNNKENQEFYNFLLELFAKDLKNKGIYLIMISVNGELDLFPLIKNKVNELESNRYLKYLEVNDWFDDFQNNIEEYSTPEGHVWGKKAHKILGNKLSEFIKGNGVRP